ncbi:cilia- and flagella-associated protein 43 [Adelges cooleyi]|uniref:cilia- and flagella-associated protein 43 n=1 Tax=Adelges cooleyi TaxID=133065 RepID=UPI00218058A7|nr:cilia- and flagella-associated protein 43 [Adelges cooleyi]
MSSFKDSVTMELEGEEILEEGEYIEEDEVEYGCTFGTCFSTSFVKPVNITELKFVSKDVFVMTIGKTFMFYDLKTHKQELVTVGVKNGLPINSIGCLDCCSEDVDVVAVADKPPMRKVIVFRYPDMKVLSTLEDEDVLVAYKALLFLKTTYIIGLLDYPLFDLVIWAWRSREKLFSINTGCVQPNQTLGLITMSCHNVYLNQTERGQVRCNLQLWTLMISSKTVYADKAVVRLPSDDTDVLTSCWTTSGWFLFCDGSMNVYRVRPDGGGATDPEICVEYHGDSNENFQPLLSSFFKGFVVYNPTGLTRFREVQNGSFAKMWTVTTNSIYESILARENEVHCWSNRGTLIEVTQKTQKVLKNCGSKIRMFTFVKPTDQTFTTINEFDVMRIWDTSTGNLIAEIDLDSHSTSINANPLYHYVAVTFNNGKIELRNADSTDDSLNLIAKMVLCDEELSAIKFFPNGQNCIAVVYSTGWFFHIQVILGQSCTVIKEFHLNKQVIDIETVTNDKTPYIVVLYKTKDDDKIAGNNVVIYNSEFKSVFQLKNNENYLTSVSNWPPLKTPNLLRIAFTAYLGKHIHLMIINVIKWKILEEEILPLDHDLNDVHLSVWKKHCVTYSWDGTYNLYDFDDNGQWIKIVRASCSDWQTGGLKTVEVDASARNMLVLTKNGDVLCISFIEGCTHGRVRHLVDTPINVDNKKTVGIGNEVTDDNPNRMTWDMINKQNQLETSKIVHKKTINLIKQEFETIKIELSKLLENNINGPEDEKLTIEEFDLNEEYRKMFLEQSVIEREKYQINVLDDIVQFKTERDAILEQFWDSFVVKPRSIQCLEKIYRVKNYSISAEDQKIVEKANFIINKRANESGYHRQNSSNFRSLKSKYSDKLTTNLEFALEEQSLSEHHSIKVSKDSNDIVLLGSISHRFVDVSEPLNTQHGYYDLEKAEDEIILLEHVINKLKRQFNKLFDDTFEAKQLQLDYLEKSNERLWVINDELRLACKFEPTGEPPKDYKWRQRERTDRLVTVEDYEVSALPYISPSQQMLIDAELAEEERIRRLLAADNFRQLAIMEMMDGVLEKRWEDELKKDVPKPKCMLTKEPEEYVEEDIRAVNEYEKAVVAWDEERAKYRNLLQDEQTKLIQKMQESIETFDSRVFELFKTKLKYESAIKQEQLKISRLRKMLSEDIHHIEQIERYKNDQENVIKMIDETSRRIMKTDAMQSSLLNTIETLKHKDNVLKKRFKSEFPSKLIYEQALVAYNRRPKILQANTTYSPLIGYQFINAIMTPNNSKLIDMLSSEFVQYLDTLRAYDDYKYVEDYKLNMDKDTWHKVCNLRRMKIESEFKIKTFQLDASDKANLLVCLERDKEDKTYTIDKLKATILDLEDDRNLYEQNPQIQFVTKNSFIEVELTGHLNDFDNTALVDFDEIETINNAVKELGKRKVHMLTNLLKYKRKCTKLEWDHVILKNVKIKLCEHRLHIIKALKTTGNILHYLKFKAKGVDIAEHAQQKVEKQIAGMKMTYKKQIDGIISNVQKINAKIKVVKKDNAVIEERISQMNALLLELKKKISHNFNDKLKSANDARMKSIVKRTKMMSKIQELHKEIVVLHTELELLLLKTFPTLFNLKF